jgi:hypothetical protein
VSHVALEHPPKPALDSSGCRHWDGAMEAQANWQAATLLVPRGSAMWAVSRGMTSSSAAAHFGVSEALFTWRANSTGVRRQLAATRRYR